MSGRDGFRDELRALAISCPGLSLRQAARRITQRFDEALAESGLSLPQVGLMALIATSADDRMAALAARAGLDPSTLSRNLRALERDGLIEIASVEKDLRRRAVWLTEAGLKRLQEALPAWRAAQAGMASILPSELVRQIAAVSDALGDDRPEG
ncbi:MarR family winged helix-turn-helix transcriptional regulator [Bosea sp. BH3]|uniref:MarR family winged helix-turn-helix transcriptional regulator n=1 Tax=Bosea sp. BH3 TaxID=2871701 RepID=UPI0021CAEC95|nr:MarR family winged helix-turn-helix transcriptional regulator [Bosea sp. BH3]MCU4181978.1 MarR family winged helix-turn-helix transcriptional regulator [Bosea sp. BH3]